jgi:hypothetical protein
LTRSIENLDSCERYSEPNKAFTRVVAGHLFFTPRSEEVRVQPRRERSFKECEREHHDEDTQNDTDVGEVLAAVPVGDGNELVEADEDHDPGDKRDRGGQDERVQEGQKNKNGDNCTERRGHPGKEGVAACFSSVAGGAIERHRACHPFGDIMDGDRNGDGYAQFQVR